MPHPVLHNDELLRAICLNFESSEHTSGRELPHPALLSLSRVCHSISEVALDFIWHKIDIDVVLSLFPGELVEHMEFLRPPVTEYHWARFFLYAPRIRGITFPTLRYEHPLSSPHVVLALHRRTTRLFPNLTDVKWDRRISYLADITQLFTPSLVNLDISSEAHGIDDIDILRVTDMLQCVLERCPRLKQLLLPAFCFHSPHETRELENAILSLLLNFPELVMVRTTPTREIIQVLSRMPSLRTLEFRFHNVDVETLPSAENDMCDDSRFTALETLAISRPQSVALTSKILKGLGCIPRKQLVLDCRDVCTDDDLAEYLNEVTHPSLSTELVHVELTRHPGGSSGLPDEAYSFGILWDSLRLFLTSPSVEYFEVSDCLYLPTDDEILLQISVAWPGLRYLSLRSLVRQTSAAEPFAHVQSHITFRGLDYLSTLPRLGTLSLTMHPDAELSPSMLTSFPRRASTPPLTEITFGSHFPKAPVADVALFLVQRFPRLETIKYVHKVYGGENSRMDLDDICATAAWREVEAKLEATRASLEA